MFYARFAFLSMRSSEAPQSRREDSQTTIYQANAHNIRKFCIIEGELVVSQVNLHSLRRILYLIVGWIVFLIR